MYKITSLLAFLLLLVTACDPAARTANDTANDAAEGVDNMADAAETEVSNLTSMAAGTGEAVVLDGTIKSPRKELSGSIAGVPVVINYGSPAVNERVIYGDLVPFNKVWRTGANEATRITFEKDVLVGADAKKLKAGTYSLFTLPKSKDDWTVIFNKDADQWGAYDYEESKDAVRAVAVATPAAEKAERMDFSLATDGIKLMWDDLVIQFPVGSASK